MSTAGSTNVNEWELYDLESDPKEMKNLYSNVEYAEVVKRLHAELDQLRGQFDVPANELKDLSNVDMHYHSDSIRKRGIAREHKLKEKEAKQKGAK